MKKKGWFKSFLDGIKGSPYDFKTYEGCINALRDENVELRRTALKSLQALSEIPDMSPVIEALKNDPNITVRELACEILGSLKIEQARENILEALKSPDPWLRVVAAQSLTQLGGSDILEPIRQAYKNTTGDAHNMIGQILSKLGDEEAQQQVFTSRIERKRKARKAYDIADHYLEEGEKELKKAHFGITSDEEDQRAFYYFHSARKEHDQTAVRMLAELLDEEDEKVRFQAVTALSLLEKESSVIDGLLKALESSTIKVRKKALEELRQIDNPVVLLNFIKLLADSDPDIREKASSHLLSNESPDIVQVLIQGAQSDEEELRQGAALLITRMDDEEGLKAVLSTMKCPETSAELIIRILHYLSPERSHMIGEAITGLLARGDKNILLELGEYCKKIKTPGAWRMLEPYVERREPHIRFGVAYLLGEFNDRDAGEGLVKFLSDPIEKIKIQAGKSLARLKSNRFFHQIARIVRDDPNINTRQFFMEILFVLDQERSIPVFTELINSGDLPSRLKAIKILGDYSGGGSDSVIMKLKDLLDDKDGRVVFCALSSLVKMGVKKLTISGKRPIAIAKTILLDIRQPISLRNDAIRCMIELDPRESISLFSEILGKVEDKAICVEIIGFLGKMNHPEASRFILRAISDKDAELRQKAFENLSYVKSPDTTLHLIRALENIEPADPMIPKILTHLRESLLENPDVRLLESLSRLASGKTFILKRFALFSLAILDTPGVRDILASYLNDDSPVIRRLTLFGLGKWKDRRAVDGLLEIIQRKELKDAKEEDCTEERSLLEKIHESFRGKHGIISFSSEGVRGPISLKILRILCAVRLLGQMQIPQAYYILREKLSHDDKNVVAACIQALGDIGNEEIVPALFKLRCHSGDRIIEDVAEEALDKFRDEIGDSLLNLALSQDSKIRPEAVRRLANLGLYEAEKAFFSGLTDDLWQVRKWAARGLSRIPAENIDQTISLLMKDTTPLVRVETLRFLRQKRTRETLRLALRFLGDESRFIRKELVSALGNFEESLVADSLLTLLSDRDVSVRARSARTLSHLNSTRAIPALTEAAGRGEDIDRVWALFALTKIKNPEMIDELVKMLENIHFPEPEEIIVMAKDSPRVLPSSEVEKLELEEEYFKMGDLEWEDFEDLKNGDTEILHWYEIQGSWDKFYFEPLSARLRIYLNTIAALGELGGFTALEALEKLYDHENINIRTAVISACGAIGGEPAFKLIVKGLKDSNENIFEAAFTEIEKPDNQPFWGLLNDYLKKEELPPGRKEKIYALLPGYEKD